jgi:hypothetical protein
MPSKTTPKTRAKGGDRRSPPSDRRGSTTKTKAVNRRVNVKKRKSRSWIWWILVLAPIAVSAWLFAEPIINETKMIAMKSTTAIEKPRVPSSSEMRRRSPSSERARSTVPEMEKPKPEPKNGDGVLSDGTKDDIDWILGHLYKILPLIIPLIAIKMKGAIMGRSG